MYKFICGSIVVLGLAGATFAVTNTASAAGVGISFNFGNVAIGYQDGYYDRGHQWHQWRNQNDARSYRGRSGNQYHDYKHTRDEGKGRK
jgi:hypothetical protein